MYRYQITDGHEWMWGAGMLLLWVVVLAGIGVAAYLYMRSRNHTESTRPSPEDIIRERYARGEITQEEYHRLKKDLAKTA